MIADPVEALAVVRRGEDVEAGFEPVSEAVRNLDSLVELVIGGKGSVGGGFRALKCKVAVEFDHGVAGFDGLVRIYLNFVIVLCEERTRRGKEYERQHCDAGRFHQSHGAWMVRRR